VERGLHALGGRHERGAGVVDAPVTGQRANDDAGRAVLAGDRDVADDQVQLVARVVEAAGPGPHQDVHLDQRRRRLDQRGARREPAVGQARAQLRPRRPGRRRDPRPRHRLDTDLHPHVDEYSA
jgi:hypothetical protein